MQITRLSLMQLSKTNRRKNLVNRNHYVHNNISSFIKKTQQQLNQIRDTVLRYCQVLIHKQHHSRSITTHSRSITKHSRSTTTHSHSIRTHNHSTRTHSHSTRTHSHHQNSRDMLVITRHRLQWWMRSKNPYHQRNPSHRNSLIPSLGRREGRLQQTHPIASLTTIVIPTTIPTIIPTILIVIVINKINIQIS